MKPVDEELELTRLLEGGSAPPHVLDALRGRGPDAAELASLSSRLALRGIDVGVVEPVAVRPMRWKKWALGSGGAALVGVAWLALRDVPSPSSTSVASGASAVELSLAAKATPTAHSPTPLHPGTLSAAGLATRAPQSAGLPDETSAANAAAPMAPLKPPGAGPERSATAGDAPATSPREVRVASAAPSVRAVAPQTPSAPPEPPPDPTHAKPTELSLLRDARLALGQSPVRALELAEQHRRLYPGGKLTQERELIVMRALVAQGRRTAALERAAAFERAFPESPYRRQVNDLLR